MKIVIEDSVQGRIIRIALEEGEPVSSILSRLQDRYKGLRYLDEGTELALLSGDDILESGPVEEQIDLAAPGKLRFELCLVEADDEPAEEAPAEEEAAEPTASEELTEGLEISAEAAPAAEAAPEPEAPREPCPKLPVELRQAEVDDLDSLIALRMAMAEERGEALDADLMRDGLLTVIDDPEQLGHYLIAAREGADVGALRVSPTWDDARAAFQWRMTWAYVKPEARQTGVYTALVSELLRAANEQGDISRLVVLYGADNPASVAAHRALGLEGAAGRLAELDLDPDA